MPAQQAECSPVEVACYRFILIEKSPYEHSGIIGDKIDNNLSITGYIEPNNYICYAIT